MGLVHRRFRAMEGTDFQVSRTSLECRIAPIVCCCPLAGPAHETLDVCHPRTSQSQCRRFTEPTRGSTLWVFDTPSLNLNVPPEIHGVPHSGGCVWSQYVDNSAVWLRRNASAEIRREFHDVWRCFPRKRTSASRDCERRRNENAEARLRRFESRPRSNRD